MPVVQPTHAFIDFLRYGSVLVDARFTVYKKGVQDGSAYTESLSTGSLTVDRNAAQRRSGQVTIELQPDALSPGAEGTAFTPPALVPVDPTALLAPFGNEIYLETGIAGNGSLADIQWVPSGLYAIATSVVDDTNIDMTMTLDLYDRSWTIAQRALKEPYNFPATTGNFADEIKYLLNQVWNQQSGVAPLQFNIVPTAAVVPTASYNQGQDPWQAALDMAAAVGYELYFDASGIVVGKPIPDPTTQSVTWNFTDSQDAILGLGGTGSASLFGDAYSTPVGVQVEMTRDGIFNDEIIQGTGTANMATYNGAGLETSPPPILAEARVTDPLNPMAVTGAMGDVPNFVSSALVTDAGAQPMANNRLMVDTSSAWTVTITAPPNPIFDVDDVCTVTRPRVGLKGAKMVLDTITHSIRYSDYMLVTGRVLSNLTSVP